MNTHRDLILLWPEPFRSTLASDCKVKYGTVHQWYLRNNIPAFYWDKIVQAAQRRNLGQIGYETLAKTAPQREAVE